MASYGKFESYLDVKSLRYIYVYMEERERERFILCVMSEMAVEGAKKNMFVLS